MTGLHHVWTAIWPNLLASAITFAAGSIWHLALVKRITHRHEQAIRAHLTAHRRALHIEDLEEE